MHLKGLYFVYVSVFLITSTKQDYFLSPYHEKLSFNNVQDIRKFDGFSESDITLIQELFDQLFMPQNVFQKLLVDVGVPDPVKKCVENSLEASSGCKQSLCELLLTIAFHDPRHYPTPNWALKSKFYS